VADGELPTEVNRQRSALLRDPRVLVPFVVVGVAMGVVASLVTNAASLPAYLGRVLVIGVAWGTAWVLLVMALAAVVSLPLGRAINRGWLGRKFPEGSVTTVELGADSVVIRRPTGTRSVPYGQILRVRSSRWFWQVQLRSRPFLELLPREMLPDSAVELIRARARGLAPQLDAWTGSPSRQMVVPTGWAAHVAALQLRREVRHPRFLMRSGAVLLISALATIVFGGPWLLGGVGWCLFVLGFGYVTTRRTFAAALPPGSTASTEFLADRLVSRNAGGSREVRFADIEAVEERADVLFLRLREQRGALVLARVLVPDEALADLRP